MTNELEKQFFDTFGIEPFIYCSKPRLDCDARSKGSCRKDCEYYSGVLYPEITDRILLEFICILTKFYGELVLEQSTGINDLKEQVLNIFIRTSYKDNFKHRVRTLFKEANKTIQNLRTHCKYIDETNKILYNEKVQLLDKNQELQNKLLKLNDLAHEVLLYELQTLDIDFDEYETHVRDTEFSPIVTRCTEMIDLIGYSDKCNKEV